MYKKIACAILAVLLLCSCSGKNVLPQPGGDGTKMADRTLETKAVWVSCYELQTFAKGGTGESFAKDVSDAFERLRLIGINTVIVHVRAFSDAFYPSKIYPWSKYISGEQGVDPGYDPLEIMVRIAHEKGLLFHAWFNPYRVLYTPDFEQLSANNPARIWREDANTQNDSRLIVIDSGIFYNPCEPEVQRMIIEGVREIIRNYDVDAVHMDDYFYPTTAKSIDSAQYGEYTAAGGTASLDQWRRENVNAFVAALYATIKLEDKNIEFGISPAAGIDANYNTHYADVRLWSYVEGFVDYLAPQIYFGFLHDTMPFEPVCNKWAELAEGSHIKLICGLAAYKCAQKDSYAGTDTAANEWIDNSDLITRQAQYVESSKKYDGIALFSYGYLFSDVFKAELKNYIGVFG